MKAFTATAAAFLIAAALSGAANAEIAAEEISFAYSLDRSLLASEEGAQAVYANLERQARRACTLPGVRGLQTVDQACVAELVNKVVALSGSAALEAQFAGSALAMLVIEETERFASVR
jgi:UrcA family protein